VEAVYVAGKETDPTSEPGCEVIFAPPRMSRRRPVLDEDADEEEEAESEKDEEEDDHQAEATRQRVRVLFEDLRRERRGEEARQAEKARLAEESRTIIERVSQVVCDFFSPPPKPDPRPPLKKLCGKRRWRAENPHHVAWVEAEALAEERREKREKAKAQDWCPARPGPAQEEEWSQSSGELHLPAPFAPVPARGVVRKVAPPTAAPAKRVRWSS